MSTPNLQIGKTKEEKKQQVEADDEAEKPEQVEKRKLGRPTGRKAPPSRKYKRNKAGKDSTDDPEYKNMVNLKK
ncbi:hypothetical protein Bca4012_011498 [Brassica carinata]